MDQSTIEWLKTSIPGIVILGAVGSIFAVLVLKLLGFLLQRPLLQMRSTLLRPILGAVRGPSLIIDYLKTSKDPRELVVTIALLLSLAVLTCAGIAAGTVLVGLGALSESGGAEVGQHLALMGSFLASICMIFFAWVTRHLHSIYMIHMGHAETKVKEQISNIVNSRGDGAE